MYENKPLYLYIQTRLEKLFLHKRFSQNSLEKYLHKIFKQKVVLQTPQAMKPKLDNTLCFELTYQNVVYKILIDYLYDKKNNLFLTGFEIE
jgi:hypothetical protein